MSNSQGLCYLLNTHMQQHTVAKVIERRMTEGHCDAVQYEEGSAPSLALKATIERTEKRFANYGSAGLLCGTDGLPHLISDPGLALRFGHAGETLVRLAAGMCL